MLLGKRPRPRPGPPMKRTTSLSEITTTLDLNSTVAAVPDPTSFNFNAEEEAFNNFNQRVHHHERVMNTTNHRRHSADLSHTNNTFLRSCSLCKRPLVPTRDIYMYRGDSAFCSVECREQAMNEDERKDKVKCSLLQASKTKNKLQPPSSNLTNNNAQTLAAAAL